MFILLEYIPSKSYFKASNGVFKWINLRNGIKKTEYKFEKFIFCFAGGVLIYFYLSPHCIRIEKPVKNKQAKINNATLKFEFLVVNNKTRGRST